MGQVWLARDELLHRDVAVKELTPGGLMTEAELAAWDGRAVTEARAAARLSHPNVVQVYDLVQVAGRLWIVMEYVPSRSLHDIIVEDGPLDPHQTARIGLSVLAALRAAHRAGVLHRDVKPHNVLVTDGDRVVLGDFGLATFRDARRLGDQDGPGPILASPYYVAPERVLDGVSTVETDLWSLGATLYTAVEGRAPYARQTTEATLAALVTEPPGRPHRAGPLEPVILALLDRDPAQRPTADDVQRALRTITTWRIGVAAVPRQRRPAEPSPPPVTSPAAPAPRPDVCTPLPAAPPTADRRGMPPYRWIVTVAAALLLAGVAVTAARPGQGEGRRAGPAATAASPSGSSQGCGPAAGTPTASVSGMRGSPGPYLLPPGWLWHRNPRGFGIAIPEGWQYSGAAGPVCFTDPDGARELIVDPTALPSRTPLAHWETEEQRLLTAGALPDYRKVAMGLFILRGAGADWEYTWQPPDGRRLHTRRLLLVTSETQAYTLSWTTRDADWTLDQPHLQLVVNSLHPLGQSHPQPDPSVSASAPG
jgi:hypothetical protein